GIGRQIIDDIQVHLNSSATVLERVHRSAKSELHPEANDRWIETNSCGHWNCGTYIPVSIDSQPGFLEVDEQLEVVGDRALDAALQYETPVVEHDQIGNGSIGIVKNNRVDRACADIGLPASPAWGVVRAREKDGSEPYGAKLSEGRDRALSGHRRFRRYATHQLYGERFRDVVADIEHQRQIAAEVRDRTRNGLTAPRRGP